MKIDRVELVKLRNGFYKDGFRRMSFVLLLSLIVNLVLVMALLLLQNKQVPKPLYFASGADGRLTRLVPLSDAYYSKQQIQTWVSEKVPQLFALDFLHYRKQLSQSQKFFTKIGWERFMKAFESQIQQLKEQQLMTHASVTDVPFISQELMLKGAYSFRVQVPIMITFSGTSGKDKGKSDVNQFVLTLLISRVDNRVNHELFGIQQIVMQPLTDAN